MIQLDNENTSNILEDFEKEEKTKFKINPVGVFFVIGSICIIWKSIDILMFLIHKI